MSSPTRGIDLPHETLEWALRALGEPGLLDLTPVRVSSTAVHALRVEHDGGSRRLVLRRFVDGKRLREDPWYVPAHEAVALGLLETAPVTTPRLVAADLEAAECDVPTLLTTLLEGQPGDAPEAPLTDEMLVQVAAALETIHALGGAEGARLPHYEPYYELDGISVPAWSEQPATWRRALELLDCGGAPDTAHTFIHRDFHPGNTLWVGSALSGVVDWTTACLGPPGIDLARMRQNLARDHGGDAAERFLEVYARETGRAGDHHPWWDVLDAVDMLPDTPAPASAGDAERLRRWESYVARAVAELTGRTA